MKPHKTENKPDVFMQPYVNKGGRPKGAKTPPIETLIERHIQELQKKALAKLKEKEAELGAMNVIDLIKVVRACRESQKAIRSMKDSQGREGTGSISFETKMVERVN